MWNLQKGKERRGGNQSLNRKMEGNRKAGRWAVQKGISCGAQPAEVGRKLARAWSTAPRPSQINLVLLLCLPWREKDRLPPPPTLPAPPVPCHTLWTMFLPAIRIPFSGGERGKLPIRVSCKCKVNGFVTDIKPCRNGVTRPRDFKGFPEAWWVPVSVLWKSYGKRQKLSRGKSSP